MELFVGGEDVGQLADARTAPGRPEIDEHDLALHGGDVHRAAVDGRELQVQRLSDALGLLLLGEDLLAGSRRHLLELVRRLRRLDFLGDGDALLATQSLRHFEQRAIDLGPVGEIFLDGPDLRLELGEHRLHSLPFQLPRRGHGLGHPLSERIARSGRGGGGAAVPCPAAFADQRDEFVLASFDAQRHGRLEHLGPEFFGVVHVFVLREACLEFLGLVGGDRGGFAHLQPEGVIFVLVGLFLVPLRGRHRRRGGGHDVLPRGIAVIGQEVLRPGSGRGGRFRRIRGVDRSEGRCDQGDQKEAVHLAEGDDTGSTCQTIVGPGDLGPAAYRRSPPAP